MKMHQSTRKYRITSGVKNDLDKIERNEWSEAAGISYESERALKAIIWIWWMLNGSKSRERTKEKRSDVMRRECDEKVVGVKWTGRVKRRSIVYRSIGPTYRSIRRPILNGRENRREDVYRLKQRITTRNLIRTV